jgi:hypothetical protein
MFYLVLRFYFLELLTTIMKKKVLKAYYEGTGKTCPSSEMAKTSL